MSELIYYEPLQDPKFDEFEGSWWTFLWVPGVSGENSTLEVRFGDDGIIHKVSFINSNTRWEEKEESPLLGQNIRTWVVPDWHVKKRKANSTYAPLHEYKPVNRPRYENSLWTVRLRPSGVGPFMDHDVYVSWRDGVILRVHLINPSWGWQPDENSPFLGHNIRTWIPQWKSPKNREASHGLLFPVKGKEIDEYPNGDRLAWQMLFRPEEGQVWTGHHTSDDVYIMWGEGGVIHGVYSIDISNSSFDGRYHNVAWNDEDDSPYLGLSIRVFIPDWKVPDRREANRRKRLATIVAEKATSLAEVAKGLNFSEYKSYEDGRYKSYKDGVYTGFFRKPEYTAFEAILVSWDDTGVIVNSRYISPMGLVDTMDRTGAEILKGQNIRLIFPQWKKPKEKSDV